MRKILLLLLMMAAHFAQAQWTPRLVRKFDGFTFHRIITHGDGYLAVGSTSRWVPYKGTSTTTAKTPVLMALDRNFEELWRRSFPEEKYEFWQLRVIDGKIHLPGTTYAADRTETAIEVCCDLQGNVLWERKHKLPECGGSSHFGIEAVTEGDHAVVFRTGGCRGSAQMVHQRLNSDGSVVWTRRESMQLGAFSKTMRTMENGDELQIGNIHAGDSANIWKYDFMLRMYSWETGKLLWEKRHHLPGQVQMNGILLLPNGKIGVNGSYKAVVNGNCETHAFAGLLDRTGNLLHSYHWRDGQYTQMADAVLLPDGSIVATAISKDPNHWKEFPMLYTFDADMHLLSTQRIDADPFSYVHIGVGGVPFVRTQDAIWVLERDRFARE